MTNFNKVFLVSSTFDYSRMICRDAGPAYGEDMGWKVDVLSNIGKGAETVYIIDNKITPEDSEFIAQYLEKDRDTPVMMTVIDPYQEICAKHWYYKLLFRIAAQPNVYFLSKYQPVELVRELNESSGGKKMVVLNYPYVDPKIDTAPLTQRRRKIVFSGQSAASVYPLRSLFARKARRNPLWRWKVAMLEHPGYPDIGETLSHQVLGANYIRYLGRFVFMFLEGSRVSLEFLKYGECGYAGCVPVGKPPASFHEEMRAPFLEIDFERFNRSMWSIFSRSASELEQRAQRYRTAFEKHRNPVVLNAKLDDFLSHALSHS